MCGGGSVDRGRGFGLRDDGSEREHVVEDGSLGPVGELPFAPTPSEHHRSVHVGAEEEVEQVGLANDGWGEMSIGAPWGSGEHIDGTPFRTYTQP